MAIHQIPATPTTPRNTITSLFSPSKTTEANHISPPKSTQTFSEKMMQENIENAVAIIGKWNPTKPSSENFTSLFQENRREAKEFTKCVDDLRRAMDFLVSHHYGSNHQLVVANKTMKTAMLRLEKEFYYILSSNREYFNPDSVSSGSSLLSRSRSFENSDEEEGDDLAEQAMLDLKLIAESMISSGYSKECGRIYRTTRKSIVDAELSHVGIKSYNPSQFNRVDDDALTHQVNKWIDAAKTAVRRLFRRERLLCDHIFAVSETIKQTCVAHTTMEGAINLFKFPELLAKSKRSPDKIFLLMNLFETISDLWPEIESIFSYESLSPPIKLQALTSMHKLSASAQTILSEFISSIQKNSSKILVPGGGIHPLTFSAMNYVSLLAENSGVLSDIITDDSENTSPNSPFPESYFEPTSLPTAGVPTKLAWIILVLLCKLDSKAELYKDIGLSYLFLANNLQYVSEKVSTTALRVLLGQDWLVKLQKKVKTYAANYESVSWAKVLSSLPAEIQDTPDVIKERFRLFNAEFEAAYRKQSTWVVPDPKLRDEIKVSIAGNLVAAYGEFYQRYLEVLSEEKNLEALVRFSPDNLGNYLSDMFHESAVLWSWGEESSSSSSSSQYSLSRCL